MKALLNKLAGWGGRNKAVRIIVKKGPTTEILIGKEGKLLSNPGDNLMDLTNQTVNAAANIYGLCDKQLACTTCSIQVKAGYTKLPPPSDEELDVLVGLKHYREKYCRLLLQRDSHGLPDLSATRTKRYGGGGTLCCWHGTTQVTLPLTVCRSAGLIIAYNDKLRSLRAQEVWA
jgi:ferredoxin